MLQHNARRRGIPGGHGSARPAPAGGDERLGVVCARSGLGTPHAGAALGGLEVYLDSDVPIGAGLSSSAALECSVALALRDLYGLELTLQELAHLARRAENEYVGVPTGIMDQTASLLCKAGHGLFLDTRTLEARQCRSISSLTA